MTPKTHFMLVLVGGLALGSGCMQSKSGSQDVVSVTAAGGATEVDAAMREIVVRNGINTAGVALIEQGQVTWQGYYGQQSEGIPASGETLFNVASITKTVTAETILRLAAEGRLSLDEPMARYWIDPDLKDDPQLQELTARMALTHTSGFMNWRFQTDDFKLRFVAEPGTTFGYSGEGFQYLARYAENRLGTPFEALVDAYVFEPLGIRDAYLSVEKANFSRIAKPLDADGSFYGYYCYPGGYCREEGSRSVAGDMMITVSDYARFLISAMEESALDPQLLKQRNVIHATAYEIDCRGSPDALCPRRVGYGLGWNITELDNGILMGHSGTDWSTVSLAYYDPERGDGLVIFLNAPNQAGMAAMVEVLELLDPDSPKLHEYRARRDR